MISQSRQETLRHVALELGWPLCAEWSGTDEGILIGTGKGDLHPWNPYDSDSDAMQLLIHLAISVTFDMPGKRVQAWRQNGKPHGASLAMGRAKATRLAIVLAARYSN